MIYPIIDDVDADGRQLINWTIGIETGGEQQTDLNKPGRLEDFIDIYDNWRFDWLDVADMIFEYPMVDKDSIGRGPFVRVTLAGAAAHPMYPRGSGGSVQGLIDARTLADLRALEPTPSPHRAPTRRRGWARQLELYAPTGRSLPISSILR